MRFVFTVLSALVLATSVQAGEPSKLKTLTSFDTTKIWQGVGRINIGRNGFCTGTLIAPNLVLTAAHCLYDNNTGNRTKDSEIEFLAGWRDGRASAYRNARRTVTLPSYVYKSTENVERVANDLALIELDQPIRNPSIKPFATGVQRAPRGQELQVVSYAKDRSEAPSLQETCHVLARDPGVYVTSCDVDFGASGSPVFVVEDGVARVVSVVSAKAEWRSRKVALTAGLDLHLTALLDQLQHTSSSFHRPPSSIAQPAEQKSDRQRTGALFIKP